MPYCQQMGPLHKFNHVILNYHPKIKPLLNDFAYKFEKVILLISHHFNSENTYFKHTNTFTSLFIDCVHGVCSYYGRYYYPEVEFYKKFVDLWYCR